MEPQNHSTDTSSTGAGKTPEFSVGLLRYVFHGVPWQLPETGYYVALYSQPPDRADITANELDYPGYERPEIERSEAGWILEGNEVRNARQVDFPMIVTNYEDVVRYFALVSSAEGHGRIYYQGAVGEELAVGLGVTPSVAARALAIGES